jgi:hypothetical protein
LNERLQRRIKGFLITTLNQELKVRFNPSSSPFNSIKQSLLK